MERGEMMMMMMMMMMMIHFVPGPVSFLFSNILGFQMMMGLVNFNGLSSYKSTIFLLKVLLRVDSNLDWE